MNIFLSITFTEASGEQHLSDIILGILLIISKSPTIRPALIIMILISDSFFNPFYLKKFSLKMIVVLVFCNK